MHALAVTGDPVGVAALPLEETLFSRLRKQQPISPSVALACRVEEPGAAKEK